MKETAPSYYEAENLAMAFIESCKEECYTECDDNTIYVYDTTRKEIVFQVEYK